MGLLLVAQEGNARPTNRSFNYMSSVYFAEKLVRLSQLNTYLDMSKQIFWLTEKFLVEATMKIY